MEIAGVAGSLDELRPMLDGSIDVLLLDLRLGQESRFELLREFTSGGPNLDVGTLMLTWSEGEVGYRITSRSDDRETLRRIGESLGGGS